MDNDKFINIAPSSTVTFSSTSQFSHDDDKREILTAEHDRDFSFHTRVSAKIDFLIGGGFSLKYCCCEL